MSCVVGWNNLNRPQRSNVKIGYWKKKENRYDRFCTFLFTGERWLVMSHYFFTSYRDIDWNSNQYRLFNSICWAKKPNSSFPTWECPVSTVDPPGKQMASSLWRLLGDCTLGPALLNGRCWMPEQASWSLVLWWDSLTICKQTRQHRCHIYATSEFKKLKKIHLIFLKYMFLHYFSPVLLQGLNRNQTSIYSWNVWRHFYLNDHN